MEDGGRNDWFFALSLNVGCTILLIPTPWDRPTLPVAVFGLQNNGDLLFSMGVKTMFVLSIYKTDEKKNSGRSKAHTGTIELGKDFDAAMEGFGAVLANISGAKRKNIVRLLIENKAEEIGTPNLKL